MHGADAKIVYACLGGDKISSLLPVKFMTHFVEIKKKLVASPFLLAVVIKCDIDMDVERNLLFNSDYIMEYLLQFVIRYMQMIVIALSCLRNYYESILDSMLTKDTVFWGMLDSNKILKANIFFAYQFIVNY